MSDLKPCPFCGGTVRLRYHYISMIQCTVCYAVISFVGRETPDKTIKAYNIRAEISERSENK